MNAHDTETRLRDALSAAARTVSDDTSGQGLETAGRSRQARWPVVALASAAAITLAAVVPYALLRSEPVQPSTQTTAAPPFVVGFDEEGGSAGVFDSATGERRGEVPVERGLRLTAVAAAADRRTFYFGVSDSDCDARILRVVLETNGTVAGVTDLPRSGFEGRRIEELAVSPDGRRLAISSAAARTGGRGCSLNASGAPLFVLDVTTGDRQTWKNSHPGDAPDEVSWAPDNRTLAFTWTESGAPVQLRVLDTAAPGRDLAASRAVYHTPAGRLSKLAVTADGRWAQAVVGGQGAPGNSLIRIALTTGEVEVLDNRLREKGITVVVADASRRHLLAWGHPKLGRYQGGRVDWFGGTFQVGREQFAW